MQNKPLAQWNIARAAIKYIVNATLLYAPCDVLKVAKIKAVKAVKAIITTKTVKAVKTTHTCAVICAAAALAGCASGPAPTAPLPFYRCEYGLEFTAKFSGDSVVLDSSRGYDVLYRTGKNANPDVAANAKIHPHTYSNARMSAEFKLGVLERDAIVRYPLLPLTSRCVRDN